MATISVKCIGENVRKPTKVPGSFQHFQLYAPEEITIPSQKSRVIDSGFQIKITAGFHVDIIDDESCMAHGLMVNRYPGIGETVPGLVGDVPRLSYLVYNTGATTAVIHIGDHLGRFRLLKGPNVVECIEVESFETIEKNPRMTSVISIPKNPFIYFARMYVEDNDSCVDKFLSGDDGTKIMDDLVMFKTTAKYQERSNSNIAEVDFVWRKLTDEIINQIKDDFKAYKEKMTIESRT